MALLRRIMRHVSETPSVGLAVPRKTRALSPNGTFTSASSATPEHGFRTKVLMRRYIGAMQVHKSWLTICAAAAVLAGCGGSNKEPQPAPTPAEPVATEAAANVVQPGAPGEPSKTVAPGTTVVPIKAAPADVEFMQKMIGHHTQAV